MQGTVRALLALRLPACSPGLVVPARQPAHLERTPSPAAQQPAGTPRTCPAAARRVRHPRPSPRQLQLRRPARKLQQPRQPLP